MPIFFAAFSTGRLGLSDSVTSPSLVEAPPSAATPSVVRQDEQVLRSSLPPLTVDTAGSKNASGNVPAWPSLAATPTPFPFQALGAPVESPTEAADLAPPKTEPTLPPPIYIVYTVQDGDTVDGLAARYAISPSSILWNNPDLESADSLVLGQPLRIPSSDGIIYDVQPGDTLSDIAARYGVDVQSIIGFPANNLASADSISDGQTIFIPGGSMPEPIATATAAPQPTVSPAPVPTAPPPRRDVSPSDIGGQAVELARSRTGMPYVSGAAGPNGFDCSGLVYWVYAQLGVDVPRSAPDQYAWAEPIDSSDMQPGDLVFFTNTYPSSAYITHVGIYAGGGGVIMAVDNGDVVREVSLSEAYWTDHFAAAGRPR